MFLTEDEVLMGKDTDKKISSVRSLTLLIFAVGWALCGRPQPEHESMMPLLSLSPLKLYPLSGNIFRKWFALYFFI